MEFLFQFLWVGYFAVALYLKRTRRGNIFLILGLTGFGLLNLHYMLRRQGIISPLTFEYPEMLDLIWLASIGLLLVGIVLLAQRQMRSRGAPGSNEPHLLDAAGANLSTLFIPRNDTNTYSGAETLRDAACKRLVGLAKESGVDIIEQKSNAHSPDVWFRLDYLLPEPEEGLSLRAHVDITVERYDYHRFQHLFSIVATVGTQIASVDKVIAIDEAAAARIHRYILEPGTRLRLKNRVRSFSWQVWRPRNKVSRLGRDWVSLVVPFLVLLVVAIPIFGPFLAIGILVAFYFRNKRRRTYVLTTGKPQTDPRSLIWMDSWQATIAGLAESAEKASTGIMGRIQNGAPKDLAVNVEQIGYWTVDGRVIRDQVAIRYRRALGFIHVVPYGENLYVAWECHLNLAAWVEETLARGVDKITGKNVHANRIVSGVQVLNEYDVADSNFLAEWLHEAVKGEVKLRMAEHRIDQEVDFTVQRESRKEALEGESARQQRPEKKPALHRFRRVS
jgi:hypothetical protein